ncbi:MAG: queuosine precursor transporter [Peptoniphilus sp.]|uniref:queuosine precursor transporter n=1 Tax=Peptoniphilus sp. TaxID=1971214 RepID=UPI002A75D1D9|nr:queuosine precursor transporter [Peptoniphilus sp.]MDY2987302.1 queuosine precursor transporter [Peptoniphilus sp.]
MQKIDSYSKNKRADLYRLMLWSLYAVAVIMKNIFATKRWKIGIIQAPAGYIFEPVTFIAQDVETETRGYSSAKTMVFWGFFLNIIVAACSQLAILLPNASSLEIQSSFEIVLGNVPRILIASLIAYLIGGALNVKIMYHLKMKGNNSLLYRAIVSTVLGQFVDNIIFSNIAFLGIIPISQIIYMSISMTIIETIYEIIFYPITKFLIFKIKEAERKDALI